MPTDNLDQLAAHMDAEDADLRARLTAPDALAGAATWYAAQGIAVFPLVPGEKRPATTHGLHDATTDHAQVLTWWAATPQANIGIPTGALFDVIDIDPPDGYYSLDQLRTDGLIPDLIGKAITPRGGAHLYIRPTGAGNTANLLPGIDYRGVGGYVVAPPSRTADGRMWLWCDPLDLAP